MSGTQGSFKPWLALAAMLLSVSACRSTNVAGSASEIRRVRSVAESAVRRAGMEGRLHEDTRVDSIRFEPESASYTVYLDESALYLPFRPQSADILYESAEDSVVFVVVGQTLDDLVPNYYRRRERLDWSRLPEAISSGTPLVSFPDRPDQPSAGLHGRHIALWPSHGWYYEPSLDRWEWQRARLFQTVEDKFPLSFVLKYLVPMLENAGAEVYSPRERDTQTNMIVVDNDGSSSESQYVEVSAVDPIAGSGTSGFALGALPYEEGHNPFLSGSFRILPQSSIGPASISWIPDLPETGDYAVYVSYGLLAGACHAAQYSIRHAGGETRVVVDQTRGAGTWVYAGTYRFEAGRTLDGSVVLSNNGSEQCQVSADAVRFGGGMGNVRRGESTSRRPRYLEAARYHLQFSGAPDTLVYDLSEEIEDYADDYRSRGEWVNWLRGAPFGPNKDRLSIGLNIPIDVSLAFHTDAGVTTPDSSIGTLSIYSTTGFDSTRVFPDGMSRMANRDLADILQTQIVDDIRALHDPEWRRRALWDRDYSEAVRPNVPSVLLELLSHQNFHDMKFGLDPVFQADVARSIYKAILRFLATQYEVDYIVQPLPVTHLVATLNGLRSDLSWTPTADPREPTAMPTRYLVQTRMNDGAWDRGRIVTATNVSLPLDSVDVVYSFRVVAINDGGRSVPSEVLAVGRSAVQGAPALRVIGAFDRVSPPAWFSSDAYGGFAYWLDQGVPDGYDISYTGPQYDFASTSPWLDDDAPGFGASHAALEGTVVAGNTHDFVAIHGRAILDAGYSFDSASDESIADASAHLGGYAAVDLLLGEEKSTPRPKQPEVDFKAIPISLQYKLAEYQARGGALLVSGAYVGSDLALNQTDSTFAANVLHIVHRTSHASTTGETYAVRNEVGLSAPDVVFETKLNARQYAVESPNAIEPAGSAFRFLRYRDTNMSAGVGYDGVDHRSIVLGFPIEAVKTDSERSHLMQVLLRFLLRQTNND